MAALSPYLRGLHYQGLGILEEEQTFDGVVLSGILGERTKIQWTCKKRKDANPLFLFSISRVCVQIETPRVSDPDPHRAEGLHRFKSFL